MASPLSNATTETISPNSPAATPTPNSSSSSPAASRFPPPDTISPLLGVPQSADDLRELIPLLHHAGMMAHVTSTSIQTLKTAAGRMDGVKPDYIERMGHYIEQAQREVPEGIDITIWQDESQDLVDRLEALTKNARSGLVLVLLVLTLFLRFRLALWVAAGIPVALLGTVAVFPITGISISTMSVMAFILVLGILVDDAIVVGERVYAHEQQGKPRLTAAVQGTQEVSLPVLFGVLTVWRSTRCWPSTLPWSLWTTQNWRLRKRSMRA